MLARTSVAIAMVLLLIRLAPAPVIIPADALSAPGMDVVFEGNPSFSASPYVSGGSGTSASPYIIDDLDMQGYNIQIKNTTDHVLLRNITFSQSNRHALYLYKANNLIIDNVTSSNRSRFLRGESLSQMLLKGSSLYDISGSQNVVELVSSSYITLENCSFSMISGQQGSKVYFDNAGTNHIVRECVLTGVGIEDRRFINNDRIEGCTIDGQGILVDSTQAGALIKDNSIMNTGGNAITVRASNRIIIEGNYLQANHGIYFDNSPYLPDTSVKGRIHNNTFESCSNGINANPNWGDTRVSQYHVFNNYFGNCSSWAINWQVGVSNTIWKNIFYHNAGTMDSGSAPQATQGFQWAGTTQWTNNGMGNFWQNHRSPDDDNNGIVDTQYSLANGGVDSAPYTNRYFDTSRPSMVLLSPSGDHAPHTYTVLHYDAQDEGTGIAKIQLSQDGGKWRDLPDPARTSVLMKKGPNAVSLRCYDRAGLYAVAERVLTLNVSADPVSFQYPTEGSYVKTSPLQISWTTASGLFPVNQTVIINGVSQQVQPTSRFITASLSEGQHRVTILAVDEWGMTFNRSINFTVDLTPPTLQILSPQSGAVISNPIVGFRIDAGDNIGIATMTASLDGENWETFNRDQMNIRALVPGGHNFKVVLTDLAGWSVSQEIDFELTNEGEWNGLYFEDPAPPIGYTRDALYEVAWNYTGSFTWERSLLKTGRSGGFIDTQGSKNVQITLPEDGTYDLILRLEDLYQNYVEATSAIVRDSVPPKVIISGMLEGGRVNKEEINVSWNAVDSSPIERYEYSVDGGPFVNNGLQKWIELVPGEGGHNLTIRAIDKAGNIGEATRSFIIDTTPNMVRITSPVNGSYHSSSKLVIAWDIADHLDVANLTLEVGSNEIVDVIGKGSLEVNIREEGILRVILTCIDRAGNSDMDSIEIIVDRQPPIVRWLREPPRYTNMSWVNLTYDVEDNFGVRSLFIHINDNVTEIHHDGGYFNITSMEEGIYNVSLRAVDRSGKVTHPEPYQIIVDRTPPSLTIDMTSTRLADRIAAVFWIARDEGSGIAYSQISVDGASWQNLETLNTYTTGALSFGPHNITVRVWDRAGNSAEETWQFNVGGGGQQVNDAQSGSIPWWILPLVVVFILVALFIAFVAWRRSRLKKDERPTRIAPRKLSLGYSPPVAVGTVQESPPGVTGGTVNGPKVESTDEGTGYIRPKAKERTKKKAPSMLQYDQDEAHVAVNGTSVEDPAADWYGEKQRVLEDEARNVFVGQQPVQDGSDKLASDGSRIDYDEDISPIEEADIPLVEEEPSVEGLSEEDEDQEEIEFDEDDAPELVEFDE